MTIRPLSTLSRGDRFRYRNRLWEIIDTTPPMPAVRSCVRPSLAMHCDPDLLVNDTKEEDNEE